MLAAQLAKSASLNSNSFQSKRNTESYLFTPQQARHHDLDALYQLAQNGLQLLSTSSGHLKTLKTSLLLPSSKFTDRTTLSKEENALIDREVETLLFAISPFLTEPAASKIVEWLVRRFRVNEFNVDTVLAVFLPYHTTDHFIKMVSILHIPGSSPWSFLNPYKKAVTPLHRDSLVKEMLSNHLLANSVVKILLEHVHAKQEHRAVINFVLSTTMRYITHIIPDRVHVSPLLSVLIQAMTKSRSFDTVSACILLVGLTSSRVSLSKDLLDSILATLTSLKVKIDHKTLISGTSLILRHQSGLSRLPAPLFGAILELSSSGDGIKTYEAFLTSSGFLSPLSMSLCSEIEKEGSLDLLLALAASKHLTRQGAGILCSTVLQAAVRCSSQSSMSFFSVVNRLHQLFPQEMHSAVISVQKDDDILQTDDMEAFLSNLIQPLGSSVVPDSHNRMILASSSDPFFRAQGIRRVLDDYNETSSLEHTSERAKMKDLLLSSLRDPDTNVLEALYSSPPKLLEIAGVDAVLDRLENVLSGSQGDTSSDLFTKHIQFILRLTLDKPQDLLRVSLILAQQLLVTKANFKRSTFVWNHLQTNESSDLSSGLFRGVVNHPEIDWSEIKGNVEEISHLNEIFQILRLLPENIVKTAQYDQVVTYLLAMARIPEAIPTQFSLVVLFFLLGTVDDTRQLDLGIHLIQLFEGVDITTLHINSSKHVSQAGIPTIDFARIVSKSGHNSTLTRIYTSILLRLSKLPKPSADLAIWVDHSSNVPMARAVLFWSNYYSLLNSSNAFSPILTPPLHNIFLTLQEETLPLLVHTWMSPSAAVFTRVVGLRHTEAFIRSLARSDTDSGNWDFQLLFPFFLTAICDTSQEIRSAAINCLRVLEPESHVESESPAEIFGLSGIPESILGELKFLDNADFRKYMKNLMKSIESVELDVGAIASLHQEILQVDEDDTGKLSRHKQRVLSYLFSHACGWPNLQVRLAILESTSAIKTTSRLPLLHHLIIELSQRDPAELLEALQPTQRQVYVDRLLLALETFSPEQVEADMPTLLPSLFDILKTYVLDPERLAPLQGIMGAMRSITVGLGPDYCQQLCHVVLSIERRPSSEQALLQLLSTSVEDDTVLVEILQQLRSDMPPERPSKRARTDR
ncbi:snoRNA-binding rRNA-processing protein utp10 [Serendipita sp. 399]|nr:snoRNA-binding rRNA-processing protein utp10 [Serendipita sp. 399]